VEGEQLGAVQWRRQVGAPHVGGGAGVAGGGRVLQVNGPRVASRRAGDGDCATTREVEECAESV